MSSEATDVFNEISKCLFEWPERELPDPEGIGVPHFRRLVHCLATIKNDSRKVGWADLASLLRQTLRSAHPEKPVVDLVVPNSGDPWPTADQWKKAGVKAVSQGNKLKISTDPWKPDWLEDGEFEVDSEVVKAPYWETINQTVPADPFLSQVFRESKYNDTYASAAQKEAVRKVLGCMPGTTVVVNLPTGSGKSTIALAPALSQIPSTSVFVVPTVALALDQERRIREETGLEECFAFIGDTPLEDRNEIISTVKAGTKSIVVTSPESVTGALSFALFEAARKGTLRYFIVDEAHLVDQWGTEFRPQFQAMAGLRNRLIELQKKADQLELRTVLMTATLSAVSADLLVKIFGKPGPVEMAIANRLRPEPSYWVSKSPTHEKRVERVVESLLNLPRPAIVYCSKPDDAKELSRELNQFGFKRCEVFHGQTSDEERSQVLERFRGNESDVVVATSAFGLGIDQSDIRTIIHACIPETIDRYYQEVGRAGRDGAPSIAVMCWSEEVTANFGDKPDDQKLAEYLALNKVITKELGLEYWQALIGSAEMLSENRFKVFIDSLPRHLEDTNEEVEKWHVRTVGLLVRSGLLEISWDEQDQQEEESKSIVIKLSDRSVDEINWESFVEPVRERVIEANHNSHNLVMEVADGQKEICGLIRSAYQLEDSKLLPEETRPNQPHYACGGCRRHREFRYQGILPVPFPLLNPYPIEHKLNPLLNDQNAGYVIYDPSCPNFEEDFTESLKTFVQFGIRHLCCPSSITEKNEVAQLLPQLSTPILNNSERIFFLDERFSGVKRFFPTLVVIEGSQGLKREWVTRAYESDRPVIFLVPKDAVYPNSNRHFSDVEMFSPLLGEVESRLREGEQRE